MVRILLNIVLLGFSLYGYGQKNNWQNLDLHRDGVFGISIDRAYTELLRNKKPRQIVVAIIDSGIDTKHPDLFANIWTNFREIPGNGLDDDHNGYIDDIHGWNFTAAETGKEDLVNLLRPQKAFFDSLSYTRVPELYRADYQSYRKLWNEYPGHIINPQNFIQDLKTSEAILERITQKIGKNIPSVEEFKNYKTDNEQERKILDKVIERLPLYTDFYAYKEKEVDSLYSLLYYHLSHGLSLEDTARNLPQYAYNNGDVSSDITGPVMNPNPTVYHATHVAGIIAAVRDNNIGIDGVADHVKIMALKVVSNIRELRDKSLAEAIRYAVDNGAKVINLSFGKPYTWDKGSVDEAVKYAMQKDVLIVHAAGNNGENIDDKPHYPNPVYIDSSGSARAWIEVGASDWKDNVSLAWHFSNYGTATVDVFAPGVQIYSTIPGSKYERFDGSSMAAPIVSGLAALVMEYYPKLSAVQVKNIIMQSVIKREVLKERCVSGGVINAYNALKLAESYK